MTSLPRRSFLRSTLAAAAAPLLAWAPKWAKASGAKPVPAEPANFTVPREPGMLQVFVAIGPHVCALRQIPYSEVAARPVGQEELLLAGSGAQLRWFRLLNPDPSKWDDPNALDLLPDEGASERLAAAYTRWRNGMV